MEADVFFNDGQNNQVLGFFSAEDEKVFLTVEKADSKENFSTNGVWIIDQYTDLSSPYWSPSTRGFYIPSISTSIPGDAVKVDKERYKDLLKQQANGAEIVSDIDNQPTILGRDVPPLTGLRHDLLAAGVDSLGHVCIGAGLTADSGGVLSLVPASATEFGGVKIGEGLSVDSTGKLQLSGDSALPGYTAADKEKILAVKADGSGLNWTTSENILNSSPVKYVKGVGHYKDETGWHTIEPAGKIMFSLHSPLNSQPAGTLECKGQKVKTRDFSELYTALTGWIVDEDSPEEFSLPDFVHRFALGINGVIPKYSKSTDEYVIGGEESFDIKEENLPAHNHSIEPEQFDHVHSLSITSTSAGSHSHTLSMNTYNSSSSVKASNTYIPNNGLVLSEVQRTTSAGAHSHLVKGQTYENATLNTIVTNDTGRGLPISFYPPYIGVTAYIYTGKILIED